MTTESLDNIANDMREFETLLICAPAFDIGLGKRHEQISVKKIPLSLLDKCEYNVNCYDLKIISPPTVNNADWEESDDE